MNELMKNAWRLPWRMNDAPHGLLDILRGCNIKCKACYNNEKPKFKSVEEIKSDYEKILALRKISAIAIIGGEPLLHPDLFEIIRFLKSKNLKIELFTNGLILDEMMCKNLANAGVDLIFLHIDFEQNRKDLPENCTFDDLNNLRTKKAQLIKKYHMEVAISITLMKSNFDIFLPSVNYFVNSPYINYFLVTLYRDIHSLGNLNGELPNDINGEYKERNIDEEIHIDKIINTLYEKEDMKPYCYLTGKYDKDTPRWVSYVTATTFSKNKIVDKLQMSVSDFEKNYLKNYKKKKNVYPFFTKQNCLINSLQILFNGLALHKKENIKFVFQNLKNIKLMKRLLIQAPANLLENNKIEHCECCPDLTVHNGKIVPVCICDNFK